MALESQSLWSWYECILFSLLENIDLVNSEGLNWSGINVSHPEPENQ